MTSAIVNSSPLIHLGDVGRLNLLSGLYASVFVPDAVFEEIRAKGTQDPAARAVEDASWLKVVGVGNIPTALLAWDLGPGETSVLAHAMERPGTEAVVDDLAARRCAKAFGVTICGTLGLVLRAARRGIVDDPVGLLLDLREAGMWLSPRLFEQVLAMAREIA
ncbi:MAG: DUF3368 domain-containing protein [Polyangiaceae bacterium]|nr:DUF3368 domain-containing protein [Polyangiaceae bacterium]